VLKVYKDTPRPSEREAGVSLIEVMVAMLLFAIMSLGLATSMVTALKVTDNSRNRVVAANLAAEAIDTARGTTDIMNVVSAANDVTVDGKTFRVAVDARWVGTVAGSDGQCSAGAGVLRYKRVNVAVTWNGMLAAPPVRADTQVTPSKRVSDPDRGVIVVSVRTASGAANPGIEVTAVPSPLGANGAQAISATPVTDAQGCAYLLNVAPGTYVVSVSKPGAVPAYIDSSQSLTPSFSVDVVAESSGTAAFQFDQAGTFTVSYASNFTTEPVVLPGVMQTTFANDFGTYVSNSPSASQLHPFTAGYSVIAGKLAETGSAAPSCQSVDPGAWLSTTNGGVTLVGRRPPRVAADPGGTVAVGVPMGVVKVTGPPGAYLKAVAQPLLPPPLGPPGDPGCDEQLMYLYQLPVTGTANVALPFGSWALTTGDATSQPTPVAAPAIAPLTRGTVNVLSGVVTVDPRVEVTP
jgi:type II secretory pathway pseudopilin PulG